MRTTLTLDDDVAVRLERARLDSGLSLKDLVNRALRRGLDAEEAAPVPRVPYRLTPVHTGAPRFDLSRAGELLLLEDEAERSGGPG